MRRALTAALVAGVVGASAFAAPAGMRAQAATPAVGCTVTAASLTWGFKESFRSYISGSIAKGKWDVAGGTTYTTPSFGWADATGDLADGKGTVQFAGSVRFTGHEGVLDTTVANPALRFDGTGTAVLLLDVTGDTQEGVAIDEKAVPFADVTLPSASAVEAALADGGTATIAAGATTLRAEGAKAFGSYETGTALDPITASVTVACPTPTPEPVATETTTAAAGATTEAAAAGGGAGGGTRDGADGPGGPRYLAGGVALAAIVAAGGGYLYFRRRRSVPAVPDPHGDTE